MSRHLLLGLALTLPATALAATPPACELLTQEEVNLISATRVEKVVQQKTGNPSECSYIDARKGGVLVLTVRDVQYAVKDEMHMERDNLEKIYRSKSKQLDTVGEGAYWLPANAQLGFRKGKTIVTLRFTVPKNQNEIDTAQAARVVEARLGKPQ